MKRILFMGARGAGKASLIQALTGQKTGAGHVMALEYIDNCVNSPSEFLENRFFYTALITAAVECDVVAMVQSATHTISVYPPLFATAFNRRIVGIVTNIEHPSARCDLAERFLHTAGVPQCIYVNFSDGQGMDLIRSLLA